PARPARSARPGPRAASSTGPAAATLPRSEDLPDRLADGGGERSHVPAPGELAVAVASAPTGAPGPTRPLGRDGSSRNGLWGAHSEGVRAEMNDGLGSGGRVVALPRFVFDGLTVVARVLAVRPG